MHSRNNHTEVLSGYEYDEPKEATDLNLITARYGGWSDARGNRNYDEIKAIPNFTSSESNNYGFKKLSLVTEERNGWNNAAQRYENSFYRNWLLLRMVWSNGY